MQYFVYLEENVGMIRKRIFPEFPVVELDVLTACTLRKKISAIAQLSIIIFILFYMTVRLLTARAV